MKPSALQTSKPMTEPIGAYLRKVPQSDALSTIEAPHQAVLVLLAYVLGKPKTWVIAHSDSCLTPQQKANLEALIQRLIAGEPLAYLTGTRSFYGLSLEVSPAVLIPRPETEMLVDLALNWLQAHPDVTQALDIGTGSAAIAVALAVNCPRLNLLASDISLPALEIAQKNLSKHGLQAQISLLASDLCNAFKGNFQLVTANLPYIPESKLYQVNSLPWEPRLALDGGPDGLKLIRALLAQLPLYLQPPALVLLETEASLGPQIAHLAKKAFPGGKIELLSDLAGLHRVVSVEISE